MTFYQQYLVLWPELFVVAEAPGDRVAGYLMGKVEGKGTNWHGHVTAVTVAPEYRRLGLAQLLMAYLERLSEQAYNGYFVDLYVRKGNALAIDMYKALGYVVYRQVIGYYTAPAGEQSEDAYDMHKALPRDVDKKSMIPIPHPVPPGEQDMW
jgi:N-terminal acetyltransferase B complex catalytic subunit